MRRFVVACLLFLSLGARAGTPWIIRPGLGLGTWTLGMNAAVPDGVLKSIKPQAFQMPNNINVFVYAQVGLTIQVDKKTNNVVEFAITQPHATIQGIAVDFVADKGVTVGSTVQQMEAAFGRNYQAKPIPVASGQPIETYYAYKTLGIGFHTKGNAISEISVWPKH